MTALYLGSVCLDVDLPSRTLTLVPGKTVPVSDEEATLLEGIPGVHLRGKRASAPSAPSEPEPLIPMDESKPAQPVERKARRKSAGAEESP